MLPWILSSLPYLIEIFIMRRTVDIYYTAVWLEKMLQRTDRETNNKGHSYPDGLPGWAGQFRVGHEPNSEQKGNF